MFRANAPPVLRRGRKFARFSSVDRVHESNPARAGRGSRAGRIEEIHGTEDAQFQLNCQTDADARENYAAPRCSET